MRAAVVAFVLGACTLLARCALPEGTGGTGDTDNEGGGSCVEQLGLPAPSDPCIPVCGNELGVGAPCTLGTGECNQFVASGAAFCTVDNSDTTLAFCTKPCVDDTDCGEGAVCTGDPEDPDSDKGCTPATCL